MRIAVASLSPVIGHRSPAVQVANMAQAFSELGNEVIVLAPTDDANARTVDVRAFLGFTPTFEVLPLSRRSRRGQSYLHAIRIDRLLRSRGIDLLYSRNLRGSLLPALRGVPTVLETHALSVLEGRQDRWVLRRLLRAPGMRGVVAISDGLARDLHTHLGVPQDRILVAHDAARPLAEHTAPSRRRPRSGRAETLRVGYTGSLYEGRGVEVLLEVAALAPWVSLDLVGGPAADAAALAHRVDSLGLSHRVTVHGLVPPARARALQTQVDVLVAPFGRSVRTDSGVDTTRWMSPLKMFEYMLSGSPIVTSDLPVLREILEPESEALMVPPDDAAALAVALDRIRSEQGLAVRLADAALQRALTEFTWDRRARRILERFVGSSVSTF